MKDTFFVAWTGIDPIMYNILYGWWSSVAVPLYVLCDRFWHSEESREILYRFFAINYVKMKLYRHTDTQSGVVWRLSGWNTEGNAVI